MKQGMKPPARNSEFLLDRNGSALRLREANHRNGQGVHDLDICDVNEFSLGDFKYPFYTMTILIVNISQPKSKLMFLS